MTFLLSYSCLGSEKDLFQLGEPSDINDILRKIYLLRGLSLFITGVFVGVFCMMTLGHNEIRRRQFIRYGSLVLLLICFLSVFFMLGIMIGEAVEGGWYS